MRIIDGDALRDEISSWGCNDYDKFDFIEAIDNAPTLTNKDVEKVYPKFFQRPKGEWNEFIMPLPLSDAYKVSAICSECNTTWDCETNFCPYCGADMKKRTKTE